MRKFVFISAVMLSAPIFGQVVIGAGKSALTNESVSLEFGKDPRGIVLPWVTSNEDMFNVVPGTFIFDAKDKKVKVKLLSAWKDLTVDSTGSASTHLQDNLIENLEAKVSIGTPSAVDGILVLEDNDKAMILPSVNSYEDIVNPAAGMMVFDTSRKLLCFFNGTVWSFWEG